MGVLRAFFLITFALVLSTSNADYDMLQDICVADLPAGIKLNGYPCKQPSSISSDDFFFSGLANPGNVNNAMGMAVTLANVEKVPGLNTLGISMGRIDYAPGGVNPPHSHPRASETLYVLEGVIEVGFLTTSNCLFSMVVKKGDMFAFPKALVHYQKNIGSTPAAALVAFNSQLAGTQSVVSTLFAAKPCIPDDVLSRAFQISNNEVGTIKMKFEPKQ